MESTEEPQVIPLERLNIEWVEPRVCDETFANRQELRRGGWRWKNVPPNPETGMPSGLIEVPDPAVEAQSELERRADFLEDPRDAWSDYLDVRHLPIDCVGVPYWIHKRAEAWHAWNESTGKPVEPGTAGRGVVAKKHAGKEPFLPIRCKAIKKDGTRCWAWSADRANEGYCRSHSPGAALAANQGHQIMLAKVKVMQAMPAMADALEHLALNASSEQVQLKAITEMMDRGGVNASTDINLTGNSPDGALDPAAVIRQRLEEMGKKAAAAREAATEVLVVDAEIVEETTE